MRAAAMRAPLWLIALLLLVIVGVAIYGYFTTPLPFGLSSVIRTPASTPTSAPLVLNPAPVSPGARAAGGQALTLGAVSVAVQGVQRGQDLTKGTPKGPPGSFTVVVLTLQNGGIEPLTLKPSDFSLVDERGRTYAVDVEATRAAAPLTQRRLPFEATVPPSGRLDTALAFETAPDAGSLTLRVQVGYGELELPR